MRDYSDVPSSVLVGAAMCVYWNLEQQLKVLHVRLDLNETSLIFDAVGDLVLKDSLQDKNLTLKELSALENVKNRFNDICDFCCKKLNNESQPNMVVLRYRNGIFIVSKTDVQDFNYSYTNINQDMVLAYNPKVLYCKKAHFDKFLDKALDSFVSRSIKQNKNNAL